MSDKKGPKSDPEIGRKGGDGEGNPVQNTETDFFNKHYNKELRVAKDEIPIVLAELNESAIAFIKKDQYERALNLLQKAYGIMDAIDFTQCRRDMYHLFIMFHNMALCYQKMQLLEECAQCIEHAFEHLPTNLINLEEKSISYRMRKIYIIGKLKLQYCAILSQIHRHKDALEQAREGVRVCHQMVNDMHQLCQFYVKREKLNVAYKDMIEKQQTQNANDSQNTNQQAFDEYQSRFENKRGYGSSSNAARNRSFSSFLSQQEAYNGFDSLSLNNIKNQSFHGAGAPSSGQAGKTLGGRQASVGSKGNGNNSYSNINQSGLNSSIHSLSSFCTVNELEKSMSYVERTAKKLLPILQEVKKRMIPDKKKSERADGKMIRRGGSKKGGNDSDFDEDDDLIVDLTKVKGGKNLKGGKNQPFDMKNILGYLNQGENLQTLSIGNIMQLQAFKLKDLIEEGKNELELTRESFILKISHLAVSYFCYSTEIRFILQMKEDPSFDASEKQKESEFWHAKSLEVACSFLPGECPLLNHINMSFQKHFAPVKTVIKEDEAEDDNLTVVKPMNGIENQKFHPIIKNMEDIDIAITPYQMTPLNAVTKPFINQLRSFNEYTESQKSRDHSFNQNSSLLKSKKQGASLRMLKDGVNRLSGGGAEEAHLEGISEDGPADSPAPAGQDADNDLHQLEMLFKRVQNHHGVDKMKLFKKLIGGAPNSGKEGGKNNNILQNVGQKQSHQVSDMQGSRNEDTSIDRHLNTAGGVDFLMDENILTNESREDEDETSISQPVRTPSNAAIGGGQHINNLNVVKSINQINNASFTNQPGLKKLKAATSSKANASTKLMASVSGNNASRNTQIPVAQTQFSHGQSAGSSFHQRPKTQINPQRNTSQRGNEPKPVASGQNVSIHSTSEMNASSKPATKPSSSSTNINQRYHQTAGSGSSKHQQVASQQLIESKSKRTSQRPFSGGIQKMIKSDNHKSRVQNFTQKNFSMYEQKIASMEGQMRAGAPPLQLQTQQATSTSNAQKFVGQGITTGSPQKLGSSSNGRNLGQLNAMTSSNEGIGSHNQLYFNGSQNQGVIAGSSKNYASSTSQNQQVGSGGRRSEQASSQMDPQKQLAIQRQQQQQIQQMSGSSKGMNQLQGAASNILASNGATGSQSATNASLQQEQTQYEDLKKKLLHEYKKMKKGSGSSQAGSSSQQQAQQMQPFLNNQKNQQQQIEQTLQNSAKVISQSHQHLQDGNNTAASNGASSNLNNSTASAHLNVYKPTFIINNSYQPGQPDGAGNVPSIDLSASGTAAPRGANGQNYKMAPGASNGAPSAAQINNPQNLQISSAGPAAAEKRSSGGGQDVSRQHQQQMHAAMSKSGGSSAIHQSFGKKGSHQGRSSGTGGANSSGLTLQNHGTQKMGKSSTSSITPNQQQMLLMNVLMSQGMDRAQAQAQVAQQMNQMSHSSAKPHKTEGRAGSGSLIGQHQSAKMKSGAATSSGNRYAGSSSGPARGVTPTTDAQKIMFTQPTQYVNRGSENRSEMYVQRGGSNELSQFQQQHMASKQSQKDYDRQKQNASQASHHTQSINSLNSQFSAANLPQASSIVTGGKMLGNSSSGTGPSGTRGSQYLQSSHSAHGLQGPSRKK